MAKIFEMEARRILICEDDRDIATLLRTMLEQLGLVADVAYDAAQAKYMLGQDNYAAMTVDLALPDQDGIALIRELCSAGKIAHLPILVISANAIKRRSELDGESCNVIDWINKPIDQKQLTVALKQAVGQVFDSPKILQGEQAENNKSSMAILDLSLPDGSNTIKDQLSREVARAKRNKTPLSLAMIDIDLFGKINDTYGHSAGNRVIQSLSYMLKQRLRQADLIGRYGGEEFAVILCDTNGNSAVRVMDGIRKDFSKLRHLAEGKEFFVTFSCGIADISSFENAVKLGDAAEKALDLAKQAGRDRVMLAQSTVQ